MTAIKHSRVLLPLACASLSMIFTVPALAGDAATDGGARVEFQDVTTSAGLSGFAHFSYGFGGDGLAGAAWFDYNNDGWLDLYLPNGKDITTPGHDGFSNALFENQGGVQFVDVAAAKGVAHNEGSAGVVAADIDNDGDQDIFLTGDGGLLGHDGVDGLQTIDSGVALYLNDGAPNYTFTRVDNTAAGLTGFESTMSAALADMDGDALLDIFVAASGTRPLGCLPDDCDLDPSVMPHKSRLYLNRSSGGTIQFIDVTDSSSLGDVRYGALANMISDFNRDGQPDLLIANGAGFVYEPIPMQLYRNQGYDAVNQTVNLQDISDIAGMGNEAPWMGIAAADFNGNRTIDYFISNAGANGTFPHALFHRPNASSPFVDVSTTTGLAAAAPGPSDYFGWGTTAQDFDLDGRPDVFFAGNTVPSPEGQGPFANPGTLLLNDPPGVTFVDFSSSVNVDLRSRITSGVAAADYDNDGAVDIAVATDNLAGDQGVPVLLRNTTQNDHRWITVRLTGDSVTSNRDAVGARVAVAYGAPPDRVVQVRETYAGSSFLSMDSKWPTFGLGPLAPAANVFVAVDWPDGPQTPGASGNWQIYGPYATNQRVDIAQ